MRYIQTCYSQEEEEEEEEEEEVQEEVQEEVLEQEQEIKLSFVQRSLSVREIVILAMV